MKAVITQLVIIAGVVILLLTITGFLLIGTKIDVFGYLTGRCGNGI